MDNELKEEFIMDMEDLLVKLETGIIGIEKNLKNPESLNEIFRVMHSVKGVAAMMELNEIESLAHNMENMLFEVRDGRIEMNTDIINLLFLSKDYLENFLAKIKINSEEFSKDEKFIEEIIEKISGLNKKNQKKKKIKIEKSKIIPEEVLNKTKLSEEKCYKTKVVISKDCQMKKMRAYMIIKECMENFYIFAETPDIKEIEKDEIDFNENEIYFSIISTEKMENIKKEIEKKAEIEYVIIEEMIIHNIKKVVYNFEIEKNKEEIKKFIPEDFKMEFCEEIKKEINDIEKNIMINLKSKENFYVMEKDFNTISGLGKMMKKFEMSSIAKESIRYIEIIKNNTDKYEENDIKGLLLNSIQLMRILSETEEKDIDETLAFKIEYQQNLLEMAVKKRELINSSEYKEFIKDIKDISLDEAEKLYNLIKLYNTKNEEKKIEIKDEDVIKNGEIRVSTLKIEKLNELISQMQMLNLIAEEKIKRENYSIINEFEKINSIIKESHNIVVSMNNLPMQVLFQKMKRVFRDALKKTGKKAVLITTGENTEIERVVMEKITEIMIHIIKNSISHGIENSKERKECKKDETGIVKINGYLKRNSVYIEISDDGRGMDVEKIYEKAVEKKIALKDFSEYSEKEIIEFIFAPGFSTADNIDEMAGRGVGMDVVKSEIKKLGGNVSIESKKGVGSKITLKIPVNSMILNGIVVEINGKRYIIATEYVNEIVENINLKIIKGLKNKKFIKIREDIFEIIDISSEINIENKERRVMIVIENNGEKRVISVDKIIERRDITEIELKIGNNRELPFSGATILGDGSVCLILDIEKIIEKNG